MLKNVKFTKEGKLPITKQTERKCGQNQLTLQSDCLCIENEERLRNGQRPTLEITERNITKVYKRADDSEKLDIGDRIEISPKQQAFITIKDHKVSFPNKVPCRLINPARSKLGRISKQILEKINEGTRSQTQFKISGGTRMP